jgi:hypothetical protein
MTTPIIPANIRKAPARKASAKNGSFMEYFKFWAPFLLTITASFVAFMSRISVLEAKIDFQECLIQELRSETLGKDVIEARFNVCTAQGEALVHTIEVTEARCLKRHASQAEQMTRIEGKIDRHIEKSTYDGDGR